VDMQGCALCGGTGGSDESSGPEPRAPANTTSHGPARLRSPTSSSGHLTRLLAPSLPDFLLIAFPHPQISQLGLTHQNWPCWTTTEVRILSHPLLPTSTGSFLTSFADAPILCLTMACLQGLASF